MPYGQETEVHTHPGHARSRAGKGSHDKGGHGSAKPPSQKAMLSRALQKANTAVQLDNAQNFEGAREAYAEACDLLHQVLQRTSADEDKRKLEAIRQTYTSRIDELDQMVPWTEEDTKALPARPGIDVPNDRVDIVDDGFEDGAVFETAMVTRIVRDDTYVPDEQPHTDLKLGDDNLQSQPRHIPTQLYPEPQPYPEPTLLQSSFSRGPSRIRTPDPLLLAKPEYPVVPAPLSPRRPPSPPKPQEMNGVHQYEDYAAAQPRDPPGHARDGSIQSWLDPIDESGGSTGSSVHSRTSSMGFRRKHIRAASGNTEAEFDSALDAAIEAAYDEGYEPMSPNHYGRTMHDDGEQTVANAMRKVEMARERVRQTEREVEMERQRINPQHMLAGTAPLQGVFLDDNSSDEEERMLSEITRDYGLERYKPERPARSPPRESNSSGLTSHTWNSSVGSNPATGMTSLSTVAEMSKHDRNDLNGPAAPPPRQPLPEVPTGRLGLSAPSVRNRRLSGQNPKQLKIETANFGYSVPPQGEAPLPLPPKPIPRQDNGDVLTGAYTGASNAKSAPVLEASPSDGSEIRAMASPTGDRDDDDVPTGRISSPTATRLRTNFSSSSLRSLSRHNVSATNVDEGSEMSPATPSSNPFGSLRAPSAPALPTPLVAAFRERSETTAAGSIGLFDDHFHSPATPGSPSLVSSDAPVQLEPCPTDLMLRPFWLMRCLYQTLAHPRGGYISTKLFVPRDVWRVKGVKLKNIEDKVANCDFLTAALLKLAKVDTFDADAVLEEMQSLEGVLEQVQSALTRKLGNEVGVQGSGTLFKEASAGGDADNGASVPRSSSVSGKSAFSWRRLRPKNSAVGLGGSYNSRVGGAETAKEVLTIVSLPMTAHPTSRPAKRDPAQVQFSGPNATYMSSLARLFDAAQAIDQIARQVEDPGLRHADKTQVGLELCTRHAAEFFGFYVCRFVLSDLSTLLDKFIKRGSEWVMV